jgi:DNA polymerase-3 subunit delta'
MNWDYAGNLWAVDMLRQQILAGNTRHAYLFSGPPGVGRRTLAIRFAQALNCPQGRETAEPCLTCRTCRQIADLQFPDLQQVEVPEGRKEILIEQVRRVKQFLSLSPYQSPAKIAVFRDYQFASNSAQNALLKTLEETPGSAIILITVDALENLLPTTVSRCEVLRLRPLPVPALAKELEARLGMAADRASLLAAIAGGRYGAARQLAEEPDLLTRRETWLVEYPRLIAAPLLPRLQYVETLFPKNQRGDAGEKQRLLVGMLNTWISLERDVLLLASGSEVGLANPDALNTTRELSQRGTPADSAAAIRCLERAVSRLEGYLNPRLTLENLMLELEAERPLSR